MSGAANHRGASVQVVETPPDFMAAVVRRFGPIAFDLAATFDNRKADEWYAPEQDSLAQDWTQLTGNLWLNPPYADIGPWAAKCVASRLLRHSFDRILFLVLGSIGTRWFADHVHGYALVLGVVGRVKFVGHEAGFPKDLILCSYGDPPGFDCWDWRAQK